MCYIIFYQKIYIVFTVQTTRQNIANTPSGLCYYQNFLILTLLLNIIILSIFLNVNNFCKLFLKFVILECMVLLFTFISYKVFKSIIKNNLQPWRVLVLIRVFRPPIRRTFCLPEPKAWFPMRRHTSVVSLYPCRIYRIYRSEVLYRIVR